MPMDIKDYAMIGDGQSIALVSRNGSIDWLCLPRFDSDACFSALLGDERNGCWSLAPDDAKFESSRRYCGDTLVLETTFKTPDGMVEVFDFMPIRTKDHSAVIRIVTGVSGEVAMRSSLRLRFDYGKIAPWFSEEKGTIVGKIGPELVAIRGDVPLNQDDGTITASFRVKTGQQIAFTMQHDGSKSSLPEPLDAQSLFSVTKNWWLDWISTFEKPVDWPDFVKRSLIVLKALTYMPSGGIVAAGTMGLPEKPGGAMNWDYRYCWLRDSTFTLTALLNAGFKQEAQAWLQWLLRAAAGDPSGIRIAYTVDGGRHLDEWTVKELHGYGGARPIRAGNAAARQRQLDAFGEIMDSNHLAARAGLDRSEWEADVERRLVLKVAEIWRKPDHGFWEARGRPRNYVYSKVMCWVAVDRFLKMQKGQSDSDRELRGRLEKLRAEMHEEICRRGWSARRGSFVSHYGSNKLDANLLLLPLVGFLPVDDSRIARTIAAIEKELMQDGLVRRRKAPRFGGQEGCFIACSCWLANCMSLQGRQNEARVLLTRVMDVANDVGLLSEEYHVPKKLMLGNLPQALSHLAFINATLGLEGELLQRGGV